MQYMLLLYDREDVSEDIEKEEFPKWMAITEKVKSDKVYVSGEALMPTETASTVTGSESKGYILRDGPFIESKEALGGFYISEVDNLDQACEYASQMPYVSRGGSVEIRPVMDLSDM